MSCIQIGTCKYFLFLLQEKGTKQNVLLEKYRSRLKHVVMRQASLDSVLTESSFLSSSLSFYSNLAKWINTLLLGGEEADVRYSHIRNCMHFIL